MVAFFGELSAGRSREAAIVYCRSSLVHVPRLVYSIPFRSSEYNPLGGFMGPYVPEVNLVAPSSLPTVPVPLTLPESEGQTPPATPPPSPTVPTGNYVIPSGPSNPGYGAVNP